MKIYLAGPMRGYPEYNFPAFDAAAAYGRSLGHEIVSPAELDRAAGFAETGQDGKVDANGHNNTVTIDFMRGAAWRDFLAIVGPNPSTKGVDAIALLPGWEKSKGVAGELALAKWIGLAVLNANTFAPMAVETVSRALAPIVTCGCHDGSCSPYPRYSESIIRIAEEMANTKDI